MLHPFVYDMKSIPIHLLSERSGLKFDIMRFEIDDMPYAYNAVNIQRNNHYVFLLLEKGDAMVMVDFEKIRLNGGAIYYAFPGQISHRIYDQCLQGCYLAVDTGLVPLEFRNILEGRLGLQTPLRLNSNLFDQCSSILNIIDKRVESSDNSKFERQITNTLLQSFIGIVADGYNQQLNLALPNVRSRQITHDFKILLAESFRTLKNPCAYAQRLNITQNYLNESIKKHTGFSVSHWIKNEIFMEAKRLLIYTTLAVKEIAHTIGYDDPTYFSKIFKIHEGVSPKAFRDKKH